MKKKLDTQTVNEKKVEQNAEAFINLADDSFPGWTENQPTQAAVEKEKVVASVQPPEAFNFGPKYLTALQNVTKAADIRSFETEIPILNTKVSVSPLTGQEEQALKSASASTETFLLELNKLLYKHTEFSDYTKGTFEEFLSSLYPPDKSMIVWALMVATYMSLPSLEKVCRNCENQYIVERSPKDLVSSESIPQIWDKATGPDIYREAIIVMDGLITFEIGLPSEKDRILITKIISAAEQKNNLNSGGTLFSNIEALAFFVKSITISSDTKVILTDLTQDIIPFLKNLPPMVADEVRSKVKPDVFDGYMPKFFLSSVCPSCGTEDEVLVDPETAFFRKTIRI